MCNFIQTTDAGGTSDEDYVSRCIQKCLLYSRQRTGKSFFSAHFFRKIQLIVTALTQTWVSAEQNKNETLLVCLRLHMMCSMNGTGRVEGIRHEFVSVCVLLSGRRHRDWQITVHTNYCLCVCVSVCGKKEGGTLT